jgi:hypothetical protein
MAQILLESVISEISSTLTPIVDSVYSTTSCGARHYQQQTLTSNPSPSTPSCKTTQNKQPPPYHTNPHSRPIPPPPLHPHPLPHLPISLDLLNRQAIPTHRPIRTTSPLPKFLEAVLIPLCEDLFHAEWGDGAEDGVAVDGFLGDELVGQGCGGGPGGDGEAVAVAGGFVGGVVGRVF